MDDMPETMKRLMWEAFSARYSDAKPEELEWYPKLKAAWDDWTAAWCAGIEAHISTFDRTQLQPPPRMPTRPCECIDWAKECHCADDCKMAMSILPTNLRLED